MYDRKRNGNSCKKGQTLLACNHKSFTEPSHKMHKRQNEQVYLLQRFTFIFILRFRNLRAYSFSHFKTHFKLSYAPSFLFATCL